MKTEQLQQIAKTDQKRCTQSKGLGIKRYRCSECKTNMTQNLHVRKKRSRQATAIQQSMKSSNSIFERGFSSGVKIKVLNLILCVVGGNLNLRKIGSVGIIYEIDREKELIFFFFKKKESSRAFRYSSKLPDLVKGMAR